MRNFCATLLFLIVFTPAFSQHDKPNPYPWKIIERIYTSDTTAATVLEYNDKKRSLGFITQDGMLEKEVPLTGSNIIGLCKWKGDILCIYTDEEDNTRKKDIHAILVDPKTKSVLAEKVIYSNPGDRQIDLTAAKDAQDNFHYLLMRNTPVTRGRIRPFEYYFNVKMQETTGLTALYLSDQLQPSLKTMASACIGGTFLSSVTDDKGQTTILSAAGDQLIAEKFSPEGQQQQKLTAPFEYTPQGFNYLRVWTAQFDPANRNILTFSVTHYTRRSFLSLYVFDFESGKIAFQQKDELNKDYFRTFKDNQDLKSTKNFKSVEDLKPDNIIYTKDRLVVFNEIRYDYDPGGKWATIQEADGVIVSIYDRQQYHLLHQFFLDRHQESKIHVGLGLSYAVRDGKIHAFGCENLHTLAYHYGNFYYVIDPEKIVAERKTPDWGSNPTTDPVETSTIMWFRNYILRTNVGEGLILGSNFHSYLTKINY